MTVHIHIYQGPDGPAQPRPPIQRPAPPAVSPQAKARVERDLQASKINELQDKLDAIEKQAETSLENATVYHACLMGLAKQISGQGDMLGANLIETLEAMPDGSTADALIEALKQTYHDVAALRGKKAN